jgi:hypothetical protein
MFQEKGIKNRQGMTFKGFISRIKCNPKKCKIISYLLIVIEVVTTKLFGGIIWEANENKVKHALFFKTTFCIFYLSS